MNAINRLKGNFGWRMVLMRIAVNMLALGITALIVPEIYFVDRRLVSWIAVAVGFGIINALIKPIVQFLTLRFIFATAGLVVVVINALMLYLLNWLLPNRFAVESIFWAAVGGLLLGLLNAFLENLLGLTPPIVSEKYPDIRQRVKDRQFHRARVEEARIEALGKFAPGTTTSAHPVSNAEIAAAAAPAGSAAVVATAPTSAHALASDALPETTEVLEDHGRDLDD